MLLTTAKVIKTKKATVGDWHHHDRLLAVLGKDEERAALVEPYLDVLIRADAWSEAMALVARQRKRDPQWLPGAPVLRLALAEGIYEREPKLAVGLLKDLHDKHPDFADLGEAYLLLVAGWLNSCWAVAVQAALSFSHFCAVNCPVSASK